MPVEGGLIIIRVELFGAYYISARHFRNSQVYTWTLYPMVQGLKYGSQIWALSLLSSFLWGFGHGP